uniref:Tripartite motif-containing protein 16-like n=1 Tax=Mola mola TaxID=94237 RepID=A0A3Q4C041_MOLML
MAEKQQQHQDEVRFCCSICMELPKEAVTVDCGHNYCRSCIEGWWDQEKEKEKYSCPQCRETFIKRPVLKRNNMLEELVEKLKTNMQPSPPAAVVCGDLGDFVCDFCCRAEPNKATMSCLTCLASFCPAHLEPHYSVPVLRKHRLVSATVPLQEKMCTKHNKLVEVYCLTDKQLVCYLCAGDEHKGHATRLCAPPVVYFYTSCAESALEDCDKIFIQLISSMQKRHMEVSQLIREQENSAVAQAQALQRPLLEEISKLRRRSTELEELSRDDDYIHVIQIFQSLSSSCDSSDPSPAAAPLRSFIDVNECLSQLRDKVETVLSDSWPRISAIVSSVEFSFLPEPKTREEFLCCRRPLTLDVTSSYPYLSLTGDNLRVRPSPIPYAAHPDRFTEFPQVLCREGLSERCYWEVTGHARMLSAAVAYKDISRTSGDSRFGYNDKSWSLERTENGYTYYHNNVETNVPGPYSRRIGVYLDYKAGILCFYHVSDQMGLLLKIQTTFIQPLYPGLGLNYEWYDVGVFAQLLD